MARFRTPWKPLPRIFTGLLLLLQMSTTLTLDDLGTPTPYETQVYATSPLYEYGTGAGDVALQPNVASEKILNVNVMFYGKQYDNVHVSIHGHISFGEAPAGPRGEKLPFRYPNIPDPPMAAVFFSSAEVKQKGNDDVATTRSMVYHRTLSPEKDQALLEELGREVRSNAITDMASFNPTSALVVTWHSLRYEGCYRDAQTCNRNTFQAVLVTDRKWTYAIYNYKDLTWLGGLTERCDDTGLGEGCFAAQVGFNQGEGRMFYPFSDSNTRRVLDLTKHQASRTVGRYIYRVSHNTMLREGCTTAPGLQPLSVYPDVAGMLGETEVYMSGPCLQDLTTKVTCVLGTQEVVGRVIDTGRVACPVSPITPLGEVDAMVKPADAAQYLHKAKVRIDAPRRMLMPVKLQDYRGSWLQRNPAGPLTLTWKPELLDRSWLDVEQPENGTATPPGSGDLKVDKVNVLLMGYKELEAPDGQPQFVWKLLTVLANGVDNSGTFSFSPVDHRCPVGKEDCDFQLGVIKVVPTPPDNQMIIRALHSDMFPLGWFVEDAMKEKHGDDWPGAMCEAWKRSDAELPAVDKDLLPCPCTEAQAYTDRARFIVGAECDDDPTVPCPLSPKAKACYVSLQPTSGGEETRCCYDKDGHLLYSGDSTGGSYSGRAHERGIHPYMMKGQIPVLSHWLTDRLPYIWCCLWAANPDESCLLRYEPTRRTPDCQKHHAPRTAFAFGDPHFLTFDGTKYTFNGYAEYWLLRVNDMPTLGHNVQLQARMQNSMGVIPGDLKATVITAVALQQGKTPTDRTPRVTFLLNPPLALQRVSVYVDGLYQDFYTATTRTYRSPLGSVLIHRNSGAMISNNFTAVTDTGVSVIVAEKAGMLQVTATVPPSVFNHTAGLFGVWDNDAKNDLRTRDGKTIVDPADTEQVHKTFGVDWAVRESESVFTYFGGMTWKEFEKDKSFTPNFKPTFPNITHNVTAGMVAQKCGSNEFCKFDYMTTLSEPIASASLQAEAWAYEEMSMAKEVPGCPYLEVHNSRRTEGAGYLVGDKVTLTGCIPGYTLIGASQFTCQQDGEAAMWSPPSAGTYCKADTQIAAERQKMAVAISVPITLLVVAALVVLVLFIVFKKRQKPKQPVDDMPRQQVPVNTDPNPMMGSGTGGGSKASINSNTSRNSIVLTEQLVSQRPPRPPKTKPPPESPANEQLSEQGYDLPDQTSHPPYPYKGPAGQQDPAPPAEEVKQPAYPYKGPAGYDNPDAAQIGPEDHYTRPAYPYTGPSDGPHVYDNPDQGQLGPEDQYVTPVTRGPPGRVQYGGPGHPRPQSTVSSYGAERTARRRDEDESSMDGDVTYAQPRRPYKGYDNQGYGQQGRPAGPPKGPPSSDTFV